MNIVEEEDKFIVEVTSKTFARFIELDLKDADEIFSDNFFDLSGGYIGR